MALTSLRLALFLVVFVSATCVSGQEVSVSKVTTNSVTLTWQREGVWSYTFSYLVDIKANGKDFCSKNVWCIQKACTFISEENCKDISPCAKVDITVTSGSHTAPANATTAPSPVSNMNVTTTSNSKIVTWTNPDSWCFKDLVVQVNFGGYINEKYTLDADVESLTVPTCMNGAGSVNVQAEGGNGISDTTSQVISRFLRPETISISDCPTSGCNDIEVDWAYNEDVCSGVTHFSLLVGTNNYTTFNTSEADYTFDDLKNDAPYDTCLYALDKTNTVIAMDCQKCSTFPEVVDNLTVTNVTDTTAVIAWESPECPDGDDIMYQVSYTYLNFTYTNITTETSFQFSNLQPGYEYTFTVLVLHGINPASQKTSIKAFTWPAALESILVRIYRNTSLFITWPGEIYTPNLRFRVSWGDAMQYSDYTEYKSYTIFGYNETNGPDEVCVQVENKNHTGALSREMCQESPFPDFNPGKPDHTHMIIGVCVSAGLAVVLSVALVALAKSQERRKARATAEGTLGNTSGNSLLY